MKKPNEETNKDCLKLGSSKEMGGGVATFPALNPHTEGFQGDEKSFRNESSWENGSKKASFSSF